MTNKQERIIGEREKTGIYEFSVGEIIDMSEYTPDKVDINDMPVCRIITD